MKIIKWINAEIRLGFVQYKDKVFHQMLTSISERPMVSFTAEEKRKKDASKLYTY